MSMTSLLAKDPNTLSPRQKREVERKNRIQERIAEFRMLKVQKEAEKMQKVADDAEAERIKLERQQERRRAYMDA